MNLRLLTALGFALACSTSSTPTTPTPGLDGAVARDSTIPGSDSGQTIADGAVNPVDSAISSDATTPLPDGAIAGDAGVASACAGGCAANQYCRTTLEQMCGGRGAGVCTDRPTRESCTALPLEPVCGCDGVSYPKPCVANSAGTSVAASGACTRPADAGTPLVGCGPRTPCAEPTFCLYSMEAMCGTQGRGVCVPRARIETECGTERVCGCDGRFYENRCAALSAGVSPTGTACR